MKTKSGKAKARKLQDWVRDALYERFEFTKDDIRCALMGESGEDIKLTSPMAKRRFPYSVECKNSEAHNVWNEYAQAVANSVNAEPLLVIKKNKHKPLAVIDVEVLFYLISMHRTSQVEEVGSSLSA
jgi:hypothetical protein